MKKRLPKTPLAPPIRLPVVDIPWSPETASIPTVLIDGVWRIPVDQDYVVEPPVWGEGSRTRNWLAVVDEDPHRPGGIVRTFCDRGRGRFRYAVAPLLKGDLLEFGADYLTAGGRRIPERWYGVVLATEEFALIVRHYDSLGEMLHSVYEERAAAKHGAPAESG